MSMGLLNLIQRRFSLLTGTWALCALTIGPARAQGPTPETGATLFPGGAYVSYDSTLTTRRTVSRASPLSLAVRPMFEHEAPFTFSWGIRRDFQLTAVVPIVTTRFDAFAAGLSGSAPATVGGTGLGDILFFLKYRFLRRDSERGTTQASVSLGPKLPTGRTSLRDRAGLLLPAGLQPGSGSADLFLSVSGTYTGLFHVERLVADESLTYLWRSEGTQRTRLGSSLESRFWLSYRPYQSPSVDKEWWVGPAVTWRHLGDDREGGIRQANSGGDALLLGITTYVSPRAGMNLWFGVDFPMAQTTNRAQIEMKRRYSFGITQQFRLRH